MNEHEKYLFDLQGYIAVPNALDAEALDRLNSALDERIAAEVPEDADTHRFIDCLPWGQPYLDLIDHERIGSLPRDCCRTGIQTRSHLC